MQQENLKLVFQVVIPGKVGIKKNSRKQIIDGYGRRRNIPSERYKNWEAVAIPYVLQAKHSQPKSLLVPLKCNLHAHFEFYFKNNKAVPDTSNCVEGPQDVMEACKVYENDKQIVSIFAQRFVSGDEKTLIKLFEVKNESK